VHSTHPAAAARARRALLLPGGRRPGAGEARRVTERGHLPARSRKLVSTQGP